MNFTRILSIFFCSALLSSSPLKADYYEGVELFRNSGPIDLNWLPQFLPYDPVIVEAGAFFGSETCRAAKLWPQGRIIAFEPNPYSFKQLNHAIAAANLENIETYRLALNSHNGTAQLIVCHGMKGTDPCFGYASSLLPLSQDMQVYSKGPQLDVPCVILDDWCREQQIDHIDVLRLELEGMELPILQSSPEILKKTQIIYVKTLIHPHRVGMTQYNELKAFLKQSNFVLLSHRYTPEITGYAIFLSRELFDAYFKLSLNMYLDI